MKLNQICFYAPTEFHSDKIKILFGLQGAPWIYDTVEMLSRLPPGEAWHESIAELQFCETLGMQFEIMRFTKGMHWNLNNKAIDNGAFFLAHIGIHLDDGADWPYLDARVRLVQESKTISHTAEAFHEKTSPQYGRRYWYKIYEFAPGVYIKYIRRINRASNL